MYRLDFDAVIIGGGMTGLAMAGQLGRLGLKTAIIEKQIPEPFHPTQNFDLRVSALSPQSVKMLENIGAWEYIENMRFCQKKALILRANRGITGRRGPPVGGPIQRDSSF